MEDVIENKIPASFKNKFDHEVIIRDYHQTIDLLSKGSNVHSRKANCY